MEARLTLPLRNYLRQITEIPLLTRGEELAVAKDLEKARKRYLRFLLANDYALRAVYRLTARVCQHGARIDMVAELQGNGVQARQTLRERVQCNRVSLGRLLTENRKALTLVIDRRQPLGDRLAEWKTLKGRRILGAHFVERMTIRIAHLEAIASRIQQISNAASHLRKSKTSGNRDRRRAVARKLLRLISLVGENSASLGRYTARLVHLRSQYHDARDRLIVPNLRLVVSIAKRYQAHGHELLDLIQEGNLGLMRAADKFDHRRGCAFATYATWWIRQAIGAAVRNRGDTIRLTSTVQSNQAYVQRTIRRLQQTTGAAPNLEEITAASRLSANITERLARTRYQTISLDKPGAGDDRYDLADICPSLPNLHDDCQRQVDESVLASHIVRTLDALDARERKVIQLRFGLMDGQSRTLEDIARTLRVSRQRAHQIETAALNKLRAPSQAQTLTAFLEVHPQKLLRAASVLRQCTGHSSPDRTLAAAPNVSDEAGRPNRQQGGPVGGLRS